MKKLLIVLGFILAINSAAFAYSESYSTNDFGSTYNSGQYCSPDLADNGSNIFSKIKNAFVGQMTGYTPQIPPSPYLNPYYGPSYNQGFYTGNQWNSHNSYNPAYPARLFGMSF